MRAATGPEMNPKVLEVIRQAQAGTPLVTAWKDAGKPCCRSNIFRAFKVVAERTPEPAPPKARAKRYEVAPLPTPPAKSLRLGQPLGAFLELPGGPGGGGREPPSQLRERWTILACWPQPGVCGYCLFFVQRGAGHVSDGVRSLQCPQNDCGRL